MFGLGCCSYPLPPGPPPAVSKWRYLHQSQPPHNPRAEWLPKIPPSPAPERGEGCLCSTEPWLKGSGWVVAVRKRMQHFTYANIVTSPPKYNRLVCLFYPSVLLRLLVTGPAEVGPFAAWSSPATARPLGEKTI